MNREPLDWSRLVANVAVDPLPEPAAAPPPDLAGRVLAVWHTLRRDEQVRRWARWALRGALVSAAVCGILMAVHHQSEPPILLTPPANPLLTPQFPAQANE